MTGPSPVKRDYRNVANSFRGKERQSDKRASQDLAKEQSISRLSTLAVKGVALGKADFRDRYLSGRIKCGTGHIPRSGTWLWYENSLPNRRQSAKVALLLLCNSYTLASHCPRPNP